MPRRQFLADLLKAQSEVQPDGIDQIKMAEDDGQFQFLFLPPTADNSENAAVEITAMIPDLSAYPKAHDYMIYCADDAPRHIGQALQSVRGTEHKTVSELLQIVGTTLSRLRLDQDTEYEAISELDEEQYSDDDAEEDEEDMGGFSDDDDAFDIDESNYGAISASSTAFTPGSKTGKPADMAFRERVRFDLRTAKAAGFKVGHISHLMTGYNCYVTVSIRMSKLGISEEAMQAWQVEPSEYLILLIHFPDGYKTGEQLQALMNVRLKSSFGMRVIAGKYYKPTLQEAIKAFSKTQKDHVVVGSSNQPPASEYEEVKSVHDIFISKSLDALLEDNLVPVLRCRAEGLSWQGAEQWYSDHESVIDPGAISEKYRKPEILNKTLPDIVKADHCSARHVNHHSFPLIAMQYLLRHFVRCTEFCLVCHRSMASDLEAIRPYVCERPLCLYQYMAMGFGPSIEHEVKSQPYVVDLLISFCYNSAHAKKLKDFPDGLALMVPPSATDQASVEQQSHHKQASSPTKDKRQAGTPNTEVYSVGFDRAKCELIFFVKLATGCPVRRGEWIVIVMGDSTAAPDLELHCRVRETTYYPSVMVDEPVEVRNKAPEGTTAPVVGVASATETPTAGANSINPDASPKWEPANFTIYNVDFDQLDETQKCLAMCKVLETLPSVNEMQKYLEDHHSTDLKSWVQRSPPAAFSIFRWIVASNRACIMQVTGGKENDTTSAIVQSKVVPSAMTERLFGMKDFMQFRFAMGAPDKEQRFVNELRKTTKRLGLKYPTLFAWHGSRLHNWHMIIREGLHFKTTANGRAYGDGVYHATRAHTSLGFSGIPHGKSGAPLRPSSSWPNSILNVTSALALNEIVNAPKEFRSSSPHYVVAQLDWIQTRYLFVQCKPIEGVHIGHERQPSNVHPQDPNCTPIGTSGPIVIPASAIRTGRWLKASRERDSKTAGQPIKKAKGKHGDPIVVKLDSDDDSASVITDAEDCEILLDEFVVIGETAAPDKITVDRRSDDGVKDNLRTSPGTKFTPGDLDWATLPLMPMPSYATSTTTKRLMRELQDVQKVQETCKLAELGWYIDTSKIDNVYQWIVELHSFDRFEVEGEPLPLVDDMKKMGLKSIILELRFNHDFPYEPPYVRVVRPRFLSFTQGGGGHIVMGGTMCMELLTNTAWSSVSSMESVLMQVQMAIASKPFARLDQHGHGDYGTAEAAEGYLRACRTHGWKVPPDFKQVAYGTAEG